MVKLSDYTNDHEVLLSIAVEMEKYLVAPDRARQSAAEIRRVMLRLSRVLSVHLVMEGRILYPKMERSSDAALVAMATRYKEASKGLKQYFHLHVSEWQESHIRAQPERFIEETRKVLHELRQHVSDEDKNVYSLPRIHALV